MHRNSTHAYTHTSNFSHQQCVIKVILSGCPDIAAYMSYLLESAYLLWLSSGCAKCFAAWKLNTLLVSSRLQLSEIAFDVVMESMAAVYGFSVCCVCVCVFHFNFSLVCRSPIAEIVRGTAAQPSRMLFNVFFVHFIMCDCENVQHTNTQPPPDSFNGYFVCLQAFHSGRLSLLLSPSRSVTFGHCYAMLGV